MKKIGKNIVTYVEQYSYSQRRKRKLKVFEDKYKYLENMSDLELDYEYINIKTEYEHNKNVFNLIMLTLLLSILTNVWSKFFELIGKILKYSNSLQSNNMESAKTILLITIGIIMFVSIIILFCLYTRLNDLKIQKLYLMIVEEIRDKRKNRLENPE